MLPFAPRLRPTALAAPARRALRATAVGALAAVTSGCGGGGAPDDPMGCRAEAVVYGDDDRRELHEVDAVWQNIARTRVVGLIGQALIDELLAGRLAPSEQATGNLLSLCPDERFHDQPALADCTGFLLAPDLVLTAGHCLRPPRGCSDYAFTVGFAPAEGDDWLATLRASERRGCRELVSLALPEESPDRSLDFALIRLDAPFPAPDTPHALRDRGAGADESVLLIGHPSGVPLKATAGAVVDPRPTEDGYFGADLDSFGGESGAPVFDTTGALLGMAVAGQADFSFDESAECFRAAEGVVDVDGGKYERIGYVVAALDAACRDGADAACELRGTAAPDPCAR